MKQTTLVYINPLAARLAHKSKIMSALVEKLGKNYTLFRMIDPMEAPDALTESKIATCPHFSHGVSYAQLEQVDENGGIFINAMMEGLLYDVDVWTDLIGLPKKQEWAAIYLGIPYDLYAEVAGELASPEDIYENAELTTKTLVQLLNENKSLSLH